MADYHQPVMYCCGPENAVLGSWVPRISEMNIQRGGSELLLYQVPFNMLYTWYVLLFVSDKKTHAEALLQSRDCLTQRRECPQTTARKCCINTTLPHASAVLILRYCCE